MQNGFRAPSLPQQFFATTSTNFIDGVPFDITTFPVSDPIAVALGAKPLDAEESVNVSIGFHAREERSPGSIGCLLHLVGIMGGVGNLSPVECQPRDPEPRGGSQE